MRRCGGIFITVIGIAAAACVGSDPTPPANTTIILQPEGGVASSSGGPIDAGDAGDNYVCDPAKPFSLVTPVGPFDANAFETSPVSMDDGTEVFFASSAFDTSPDRGDLTNRLDIVSFKPHLDGTVTTPSNSLTQGLNVPGWLDADPALMPSGLEVVTVRQRSDSAVYEVRYASRTGADAPFGTSTVMTFAATTVQHPHGLSLVPSGGGAQLFFADDLSGGTQFQVYSSQSTGALSEGKLAQPVAELVEVPGTTAVPIYGDEVALNRAGTEMFVSLLRQGATNRDIFRLTRPASSGAWTAIESLTDAINDPQKDDHPRWVSRDGCLLLFSSQRTNVERMYLARRR